MGKISFPVENIEKEHPLTFEIVEAFNIAEGTSGRNNFELHKLALIYHSVFVAQVRGPFLICNVNEEGVRHS